MSEFSVNDEEFQRESEKILSKEGEIDCVIRYSHSAGARSYEFFENNKSFKNRLEELPPSTSVILFKTRQFPLRGISNEDFVKRALKEIPDGEYWTLVRTSLIIMGSQSWYPVIEGDSLNELEEELKDSFYWSHPVALGLEPDWHDLDKTIEALVPDKNGKIKRGVY